MFVCVFAKKFPALASQSCCEVSRPRAVGEYEYRLLTGLTLVVNRFYVRTLTSDDKYWFGEEIVDSSSVFSRATQGWTAHPPSQKISWVVLLTTPEPSQDSLKQSDEFQAKAKTAWLSPLINHFSILIQLSMNMNVVEWISLKRIWHNIFEQSGLQCDSSDAWHKNLSR